MRTHINLLRCTLLALALHMPCWAPESTTPSTTPSATPPTRVLIPSESGMQLLIAEVGIGKTDDIWIISSDKRFEQAVRAALERARAAASESAPEKDAKQAHGTDRTVKAAASEHNAVTTATLHTITPKEVAKIGSSATIIILPALSDLSPELVGQLSALPDGTTLLLPDEPEGHPELRLQQMHALPCTLKQDLLLYEYTVRALSIGEEIAQLYGKQSGFCIEQKEAQVIRDAGGDPTYGEITLASTEKLFTELIPLTADDIFYDLGAGIGKLTLWVYLATPVRKVVGIELSDTRYAIAQNMITEVARLKKVQSPLTRNLNAHKTISMKHADIAQGSFTDATVIFMCATCFHDTFLAKMADIFIQLKPGTRIITLKELPKRAALELTTTYTLPMTWSPEHGSAVYVYTVVTPA